MLALLEIRLEIRLVACRLEVQSIISSCVQNSRQHCMRIKSSEIIDIIQHAQVVVQLRSVLVIAHAYTQIPESMKYMDSVLGTRTFMHDLWMENLSRDSDALLSGHTCPYLCGRLKYNKWTAPQQLH